MIASECVPFAKTGGLADVCGALPRSLEQLGHRCTVFIPAHSSVHKSGQSIEDTGFGFTIPMAGRHVACRVLRTRLPHSRVDVYLIDQPQYFDREGLYGDRQGDYRDNCERFAFFSKAVAHAIEQMDMHIDVAHCHDWQTGLIPAYVATGFGGYGWSRRAVSIMTIHNLAYQGRFWHYDMAQTGLDWKYFNWKQMEFYGDVCFLKTGIVFSDLVTTVSPTYAKEIRTSEQGCGLEGVLLDRGENLVGIVNGVDYDLWNPSNDANLPQAYGLTNWKAGKQACKKALQEQNGLAVDAAVPLIGIVSRLADQKGWDLIIPLLRKWLHERPVQWMILGTGEERYQQELRRLADHSPRKLYVQLEFSDTAAHRIEAASDIFLMPSRYEPCGLNQLYSLRYGTVPVVHATGGLVDTVVDANEENLSQRIATGFQFHGYFQQALEQSLDRAVNLFQNQPEIWERIVQTGMACDWSWSSRAAEYAELYKATLRSKLR